MPHNTHFTMKVQPSKQGGNMIVMALFVIVVVSLLAAALINIISASSNSAVYQVYGLRANQAAKSGIEHLLSVSFQTSGNVTSCNRTVTSVSNFSNVAGLSNCRYAAVCETQTISFNNIDRLYFKFSSTGSCQVDNNIVSRTLSVDAIEEIAP